MNGSRSPWPRRTASSFSTLLAAAACAVTLAATVSLPAEAPAGVAAGTALTCSSLVNCARITIDVFGNGRGTVVSEPPGIDCKVDAGVESGDCTETFTWPKTEALGLISLHVTAAEGFIYCRVVCGRNVKEGLWLEAGREYRVEASLMVEELALSVSRSGAGTGRVTSSPAGISCGADCVEKFDYGATVSLTATPDAGAVFRAWTGACAGKGAVCTLQITGATSTNAVFELPSSTPPPATPAPPTPPPPPPAAPADRFVDADVGAAVAGRTGLGARAVRIELSADEPLEATLQLRRGGKTLASKRFLRIRPGERVLTLLVPRTVPAGPVTVRLALADLAGNRKGARRQIMIAARADDLSRVLP